MRGIQTIRGIKTQPMWPFFMALLGAGAIGFAPIFVKLTTLGPIATAFYRLLLAIPLIGLWRWVMRHRVPRAQQKVRLQDGLLLLAAGAFFAGDLMLWHMSLDMTTVMNATLFNNFVPFFVPLVTYLLYRQKTSMTFLVAVFLAIAGSVLLSGGGVGLSAAHLEGDLLALFSALLFVGYALIVQRARQKYDAPTVMLWTSISNACCLGFAALGAGESLIPGTLQDWVVVGCLALFVHTLGQGLLAYAMAQLSAALVTVTMLVSPIVSGILAWFLFGEALSGIEILGAVIVMSSIALAHQNEKSPKIEPTA